MWRALGRALGYAVGFALIFLFAAFFITGVYLGITMPDCAKGYVRVRDVCVLGYDPRGVQRNGQ